MIKVKKFKSGDCNTCKKESVEVYEMSFSMTCHYDWLVTVCVKCKEMLIKKLTK